MLLERLGMAWSVVVGYSRSFYIRGHKVTPDIHLDNIYFNWNAAMEMLVINVLGIFLDVRCNYV